MKNSVLSLLFLLFSLTCFSQGDVEKIKISGKKGELFVGIQQEIYDWYLYHDVDGMWYLANLQIPEKEVRAWFEKRKNSQNIFRGRIENGLYPTLRMIKENEVGTDLKFYVKREKDGKVVLTSVEDAKIYVFSPK
ncbi:MAG: hypothetical protein EP338_14070 [Bacteroidetes bacterium]|nr:MAG: hypothetical protein EP338_14070 [Bacteroidota bacterium]